MSRTRRIYNFPNNLLHTYDELKDWIHYWHPYFTFSSFKDLRIPKQRRNQYKSELKNEIEQHRINLLQNDLRILLQIYETSKTEPMTLSKLYHIFDGRMNDIEISQSLDHLFDMGMLDTKFEKYKNKWSKIFIITDEAKYYIENIYNKVIISNQ